MLATCKVPAKSALLGPDRPFRAILGGAEKAGVEFMHLSIMLWGRFPR